MTCSGRFPFRLRLASRCASQCASRWVGACIALAAGLCVASAVAVSPATAQVVDHRGTEFLLPFLPIDAEGALPEVQVTSDVQAQVTLEYPAANPDFSTTINLDPGVPQRVSIPASAAQGWVPGTVQNNAVRAVGSAPFSVTMATRGPASGDAALALPVDALKTRYYVLTYPPQRAAQFGVVAATDGTEITITPAADLQGGLAGGVPFSVTLDRGEGLLGQSTAESGEAGDLSGTLIEASAPVAVTNGTLAAEVPPATAPAGALLAFALPISSWGTEVVAAPLPQRPDGSAYRIIAAEDNTTIQRNGVPITLNAGQVTSGEIVAGPQVFQADQPIFGIQVMTGAEAPGAEGGGPALLHLVSTDQFLPTHTVSTAGGEPFGTNYVTLIAASDEAAADAVTLSGTPIDGSAFTRIDGTAFSYAVEPVPPGTFTTTAPSPHGVAVSGFGDAEGSLYPAGLQYNLTDPVPDSSPPVCEGDRDGSTVFGSVRDDQAVEDTGVFVVGLGPQSFNLRLQVDPFEPGAPVVAFRVSSEDPAQIGTGTVLGRDGAGNTCSVAVEIPGAAPVRVTPAALAFGRQQVGGTSDPKTIVLENVSDRAVTVSSVEVAPAGPFVVTEDTGDEALAPGARRTLQLEFRPSRDGAVSGAVTFTTNAGPSVVALSGTGLSIDVTTPAESGAGEAVPVSADLPPPFFPQTRRLCYRPGGAADFTCDDLPPPATPLGATSVVAGAIPATAATERGLEYYLFFEETSESESTVLTFPATAPREAPSQIRVRFSALQAGGEFAPETYRMISVPASLDDPVVGSVLVDDYGPPDITAWRLVRWNPAAGAYEDIQDPDARLPPGRAYFLISRTGTAFDTGAGRSADLQLPVTLTLSPGWHQIASPFAFPVAWSSVEGADRVEGPFLFDGEGGFIPNQTTLDPWNGYFVLNETPEPVVLRLPARPARSSPQTAAPAARAAGSGYALTLSVVLPDGRRDVHNRVGTHAHAEDGRDPLDASEPPPIGTHVRLSVREGERRLAHSFRAPSENGQVWDLELSTSEVRARDLTATLTVTGTASLPAGHRVFVVDPTGAASLPVVDGRVRVVLPAGAEARRLRLIVGTDAFAARTSDVALNAPHRTLLLPGSPNPVRSRLDVPYTLAARSAVRIDVFDILGRRVRRLVDREQAPGAHRAVWDVRTDGGRPAASGVYFLRMQAGDYRSTQKLVVIR